MVHHLVKCLKVNNILVANIDGTNSADASVAITKSGGSPIMIASTVAVPADSTLVVVDKNTSLYLEEGDNYRSRSISSIRLNYYYKLRRTKLMGGHKDYGLLC